LKYDKIMGSQTRQPHGFDVVEIVQSQKHITNCSSKFLYNKA